MNTYTMKLKPEKSMTARQQNAIELIRSVAMDCHAAYQDAEGQTWILKSELTSIITSQYDKSLSTVERWINFAEGHTIFRSNFNGRAFVRPISVTEQNTLFSLEPTKSSRITTLAKMVSDMSEMEDLVVQMRTALSCPDLWGDDRAVGELIRVIKDMAWSTANACDELGLMIEQGEGA